MTLCEFKAWFEGFTEAIDKAPTIKQWARIKERVGEIDGQTITWPIYVDRWVTPYPYRPPYYWTNTTGGVGFANAAQTLCQNAASISTDTVQTLFDSSEAMFAAGQAEAGSMQ